MNGFCRWSVIFISYLYCVSNILCAVDSDPDMQEANLYFEAGDYKRAGSILKSKIDDDLPSWQKEIVTYDYGTALLAQNKWEEALSVYDTIVIEKDSSPLLARYLETNRALARLLLANSEKKNLKTASKVDQYNALIFLYREVLRDIERANDLACRLSAAEGASSCEEYLDLAEMRSEAKRQYADLLHDYLEFLLQKVSFQEGGTYLLVGAKSMLQHLSFLIQAPIDRDLKHDYMRVYLQQDSSWKPLWKSLDDSLEKTDRKNIKSLDFKKDYHKAQEAFFNGLALMQQENFEQSRAAIQKSILALDSLLEMVYANKPLNEIVDGILNDYSLVLLREHIQETQLLGLLDMVSHLDPLIEKEDDVSRKNLFVDAKRNLLLAEESLKKSKFLQGRMYVEESRYFMKNLAQSLDRLNKHDPEFILKDLIDAQELALRMSRIRLNFDQNDPEADKEADSLLYTSQSRIIDKAEAFFPAVIDKQNIGFKQEKLCQRGPWDEVVPLFNRGLLDATLANQLLKSKPSQQRVVIQLQERVLKAWKEALDKLQSSKQAEKKEEQQSKEENKPQEEGQAQPKTEPKPEEQKSLKPIQPGGSDLNDVLRLLQEMENDDRSKPKMIESSSRKEVERPW